MALFVEFESDNSFMLTEKSEGHILLSLYTQLMEEVFSYENGGNQNQKECLFCHLFLNFCCLCWLLRSDVRYVRDCIYCKCCAIYAFKLAHSCEGQIAQIRIDGNTVSDHLFICDICLAETGQRCEIICKRREKHGRCWPTFHEGCEIKRCDLMEKRNRYFKTQRNQTFSHCITAVGKGLRESWGVFNTNRKIAIANLKKKKTNWTQLANIRVKLAWHSRKLRLLSFNVTDLSNVLNFEISSYTAKEINWMRKTLRTLKKSLTLEESTYNRIAIELKKEIAGSDRGCYSSQIANAVFSPLVFSPPPPLEDFDLPPIVNISNETEVARTAKIFPEKIDILKETMELVGIETNETIELIDEEEEIVIEHIQFSQCSEPFCPFPHLKKEKETCFAGCINIHIANMLNRKTEWNKAFGSTRLDLKVVSVFSLISGNKVSDTVMDSYTALLNQETIRNYYAFPSKIPNAFFRQKDFFSFIEIKNLKWILYPFLFQNHWVLFVFELKREIVHIYNSVPDISIPKHILRLVTTTMRHFVPKEPSRQFRTEHANVAIQKNNVDCGVHVLFYMSCIVKKRYAEIFRTVNTNAIRVQILNELFYGKLFDK